MPRRKAPSKRALKAEADGADREPRMLGAGDVAALCDVDLKTVHNWIARGVLRHFRTPGRHLRFRPRDVVAFLRAYGFSVPAALETRCESVLVLASPETRDVVAAALAEDGLVARAVEHPYDALILAGVQPIAVTVVESGALPRAQLALLFGAMRAARPAMRCVVVGGAARGLPEYVACVGAETGALRDALGFRAPGA